MQYDPTRRSLYTPESGEPQPDFRHDWPVEWICAELSRLAYYRFDEGDAPRLTRALTAAGFSEPVFFNAAQTDTQAFACLSPRRTAFIAFRGTQAGKPRDFIADARFGWADGPGGSRIHSGFAGAFDSVVRDISAWLNASGAAATVATGHSLGAALATLFASARPDADLVTFGSPRVGDAAFVATFAGRSVRRYVDCTDVVTTVPPEGLGFRHLDGEIYIDRDGAAHAPAPGAEAMREDRRTARRHYLRKHAWKVWRNVMARDLADHAPVNYVSGATGRREPD